MTRKPITGRHNPDLQVFRPDRQDNQDNTERLISFLEPLSFLQFKASRYGFAFLEETLQNCSDEIYDMIQDREY